MKLTVIADDSTVLVDGVYAEIDLTAIPIPSNLHALQWDGSTGHIEYKDVENEDISSLPSWASDCVTTHVAAIAAMEADTLSPEELVRIERDFRLAETDWWAVSDRAMTAAQSSYRQALRDITGQSSFPNDITWPTKPA